MFKYTKNDEDLLFLMHCYSPNTPTSKSDTLSLSIENQPEITELDLIIEEIFKLAKEDPKVNEFKKLRKNPTLPKNSFSVLNSLCYILSVRSMLLTGTLKNKDSIDQYTAILKQEGIKFDPEFYMLEIRAGRISEIENAEGLDKLYCEKVQANKEYFICSGLRNYYKKEELLGNVYLFLLNIKKVKFKTLESEGMICCCSNDDDIDKTTETTANDRVVETLKTDSSEGSLIKLENGLDIFDEIEFGKVDLNKAAYRKILQEFRIVENHLCFKGEKVKVGGKYIKTNIKNGPVQ